MFRIFRRKWKVGDRVWIYDHRENQYPGIIAIAEEEIKCSARAPECGQVIKKGEKYAKCIKLFEGHRITWTDVCLRCNNISRATGEFHFWEHWNKWEEYEKTEGKNNSIKKEVVMEKKQDRLDIEELEKELECLLEKMRQIIRPEKQEEFLDRFQKRFWELSDQLEEKVRAERGLGAKPTRDEYKKYVVEPFGEIISEDEKREFVREEFLPKDRE